MLKKLMPVLAAALLCACSESPKFKLMDPSFTGVDFSNDITETDSFNIMSYEYIYNGAGVGIGDLNNDDLPDLIFTANQVSPKVYLNEGKFKFRDITKNFPGMDDGQWFSGVAVIDINDDGRLDVYFTSTRDTDSVKSRNRLWVNQGNDKNGDPSFIEMAGKYGIDYHGQSVNAGFFDYDRDGDLDLYILNNSLTKRMDTQYRPKIVDGSAMNNDKLFRNNGDGTFTDVTLEAGIRFEGFGLGLAFGDVNKDGYPDIYVSNDYLSNDLLYINRKDGTFSNDISRYISYQTKSSMGNDMADVNNDGLPDMFTLDMLPETFSKQRQTINGFSYMFYINDYKFGFEHQYLRNMLHVNNGLLNGELLPFSEMGQMAGIYKSEWSWSPLFADYDNDGDKDLLIANGYPRDMTDKDWTKFRAKVFGSIATAEQVIDSAPQIKVPNLAFENKGNLNFERKNNWLPAVPSYSYGAAFVDLDNDGDLDYVTNNIDDKAFILKNMTVEKGKKTNFIRIKLKGTPGNSLALGAKVEIWSGGKYQFTEHFLTRGYASSVDPVIHFGIGSDKKIDSLRVFWPSGFKVSVLHDIPANTTAEIVESEASQTRILTGTAKQDYMFSKCGNLIDYTHEQDDYADFFFDQNIIPHKFSQIGPRMTKGDVDGDRREDLIIGSTNKLPTEVFLRKGNTFVKTSFSGLTEMKPVSEAALAVADIDKDGDNDIIAVAGGYEKPETDYVHYIYINNKNAFEKKQLPIPAFPASVLKPCDYDHDGDMDFFIGSRVKKGMYPYANHSWIVKNENGNLVSDQDCKLDLGMVTDAVWSDYDRDGWEDLIVTRDWNSIVIVKNENGKKLVPQSLPGLENYHGIWYSIVAGDFDGDGDDDYIAGNLGLNTRFNISNDTPLNLYAIDLDQDGIIDPVSTGYWKDRTRKMTEYPINYLDELWAQSSFFRKRFRSYKGFSGAPFKDYVTADILKRMDFKLYVNTASSYVIWNDGGNFRWQKLPDELQVSPLTRMIVKDLNNDNYPDIIAGGNDTSYDVATGYYDANKGFVLLSRGKEQGFTVLPPSKSGLLLNGMVESLLYLDGDTSLVVGGINRSKVVLYKKNK